MCSASSCTAPLVRQTFASDAKHTYICGAPGTGQGAGQVVVAQVQPCELLPNGSWQCASQRVIRQNQHGAILHSSQKHDSRVVMAAMTSMFIAMNKFGLCNKYKGLKCGGNWRALYNCL